MKSSIGSNMELWRAIVPLLFHEQCFPFKKKSCFFKLPKLMIVFPMLLNMLLWFEFHIKLIWHTLSNALDISWNITVILGFIKRFINLMGEKRCWWIYKWPGSRPNVLSEIKLFLIKNSTILSSNSISRNFLVIGNIDIGW